MPDQHPAVAHLLAAHVEAERLAEAAGGPDGWWVIEPRYTNPFFEIGSPLPEPDHAVIHNMQGGDPVVWIEIGDVDTAKRKAGTLLIQSNNPRAVLLRVTQERDILAEHADDYGSCTCGRASEETTSRGYPFFEAADWPCRTVLGLAKAWGWKEATGG